MLLEDIMNANMEFTHEVKPEVLNHCPQKHLAIVTCMDTRLVEILEPALGIHRGEAVEIKNAGNYTGGPKCDVIRSLIGAVYSLGVTEIAVIGHTNCGMANVNIPALKEKMKAAGVQEEAIEELDLDAWFGSFCDETDNVLRTVDMIRRSPYLPKDIPVHGFMMDIETVELTVLANGYQKAGEINM